MAKGIGYIIDDGTKSDVGGQLLGTNTVIDNNWTNINSFGQLLDGTRVRYAAKFDPVYLNSAGQIAAGQTPVAFFGNAQIIVPTTIFTDFGSPATASATAINAAVTDTGVTQTYVATNKPDVARPIVATPGGTTANVTAVSMTLAGNDGLGNPLTEVLPPFTAGAATAVTSLNCFGPYPITVTQPAIGAAVTVALGTNTKIGLNAVVKRNTALISFENGVRVSTNATITPSGTMSQNLVAFNTNPNGQDRALYFIQP